MIKTKDADQKPAKTLFPPWSPIVAVILTVAAYLLASVGGEIIILLYGLAHRWNWHQISAWSIDSSAAQFINFFVVYSLMALIVYLFVKGYKTSLRKLGVVWPQLRDIGWALLAIPLYIGAYFLLLVAMQALFPSLDVKQEQQLGFDPAQNRVGLFLTFISLVILPPLVEEFVVRGFLFTSFLKRLRFLWAALLTSAFFGLAHLQFGTGEPLLWVAAIDTFVLSIILCFMRYKTGSLWPGIFLHAMKNLVAFTVIFVLHLS
ncbi:MAG: hypothetical protein JWR85_4088 [Marmoricola sp.]|nr:hypothetical protein [Marmoricola sp.]